MTATKTITWRPSDHWHPGPPPGWDGRHSLSVRGIWQNCDAAGVALACSCGQEAHAALPGDFGEDGEISLAALNELADAHLRETAAA
jgi:hypothetical protein